MCLVNTNAPHLHPNKCLAFLTLGESDSVPFQFNFSVHVAFKDPIFKGQLPPSFLFILSSMNKRTSNCFPSFSIFFAM